MPADPHYSRNLRVRDRLGVALATVLATAAGAVHAQTTTGTTGTDLGTSGTSGSTSPFGSVGSTPAASTCRKIADGGGSTTTTSTGVGTTTSTSTLRNASVALEICSPTAEFIINTDSVREDEDIAIGWQLSGGFSGLLYDVTVQIGSDTDATVLDTRSNISPSGSTRTTHVSARKLVPETAQPVDGESPPTGPFEGGDEGSQKIVFKVVRRDSTAIPTGGSEPRAEFEGSFDLDYDTAAPSRPELVQVEPGERNLKVTWTANDDSTTLGGFRIYAHATGNDRGPDSSGEAPEDMTEDPGSGGIGIDIPDPFGTPDGGTGSSGEDDGGSAPVVQPPTGTISNRCGVSEGSITDSTSDGDAESGVIDGLITGCEYELYVVAIDRAGNESFPSGVLTQYTEAVDDFYERYRRLGGTETGGFCFVATAAYGDAHHPDVEALRALRDRWLLPSAAGRAFVLWYYEHGPALAAAVTATHTQALARAALWPVVTATRAALGEPGARRTAGAAGALLAAGLFALGGLTLRRGRAGRRGARGRRGTAAGLALLVAGGLGAPGEARAEDEAGSTPRNFAFEVKLGPYKPSIDSEPELNGATPYADAFGGGDMLMLQLELDWEFYKFTYGTVAVGGMVGFGQAVGHAYYPPNTSTQTRVARDTTVLNVFPTAALLIYRFDYLTRQVDIPIVPYAKAGLAYYLWTSTDGIGNVSDAKDDEVGAAAGGGDGYGGVYGTQLVLGASLHLDFIDESSARKLDQDFGINDTHLFIELVRADVDRFGTGGFDLSDTSFLAGFMFEF